MNSIHKNKVIRLFFLIAFFLWLPLQAISAQIDVRVSHGDDDAEETFSNGSMNRGSSDLEMSWDGHVQVVGIRFENIIIPNKAVITNAYIKFRADGNESDATNLVIIGEADNAASRFSGTDHDITGRTPTTALVNWNNVAPWNDYTEYDTPDLRTIVQEIVNRVGWVSGSDMAFIITGTGQRRADSYNESSSNAPLLHVEYDTGIPFIQVDKTLIASSSLAGDDPADDTFTITNTGDVNLNYSVADDVDWVSLSSNSGILAAGASTVITVDYDDVTTKVPGTYDAIITIEDAAAPNSPVTINIALEIQGSTFEGWVLANEDDAEEDDSGGIDLYSGDLELITESTDQIVGIRFQNIAVPQGGIIHNAYIEFDVDEDENTNPTNLDIYGEAQDNPGAFTTNDNDISARDRTNQFIEWDNLPDWNNGEQHQTPDLKSIVQEIIGRPGWASGNAMVFTLSGAGKRVAESYDGDGEPPKLYIEYSAGSFPFITVDNNNISATSYEESNAVQNSFLITNSGNDTLSYTMTVQTGDGGDWIAVSNQDDTGTLASGASATHTITFTNATLNPGNYSATIQISGINTPNSPYEIDVALTVLALPESSSCGDVPLYAENLVSPAIMVLLDVSSSMTSLMSVSSESNPKTSDLSTIVQEIVNRDGWAYENSMVFIITGSGKRVASSYDGSSGGAPLLHVEYNDGEDKEINIRVSQGSDDAEESSAGGVEADSSDLELVTENSVQKVGIRFQNVAILKNATITNAYIEFEIDELDDEATSLTIHGQSHDNPSEFSESDDNISDRTTTSSSVAWSNVEAWDSSSQMSRIDIGKEVISDLVKDRSISWGFGTWCAKDDDGYTSAIEYTKIHVGCNFNDDDQQAALQAAIAATTSHRGTPFDHSIKAAKQYFNGEKKDQDGAGELYSTADCQPMFLIDITDGLGNGTVAEVATETNGLCDINVSPIAVGFGIDNAVQINEMAKVSNERGNASLDLYALHEEVASVGQPFLANNREELVTTLAGITQTIKTLVFYGSAPAPTTSVDQGDLVILAKFNAGDWSGELEALQPDPVTGEWDNVLWRATEQLPVTRNVFTINPGDVSDLIKYSDLNLINDNYFDSGSDDYFCKPFGAFINSIPIIVGNPAFHYDFDNYNNFIPARDPMVYIGSNDGALHAFNLDDGIEQWAFVPLNLHAKLDMSDEPGFNMCSDEYCHQYFVDGSPQVADIYDGTNWKTILICGERKGGDAYFALDVTLGTMNENDIPGQYLWQFRDNHPEYLTDTIDNDGDTTVDEADEDEYDNQLGETWSNVSIDRVAYGTEYTTWAVFFGSGYSSNNQDNKESYLYGIEANDQSPLWTSGGTDFNRIKLSATELLNDVASPPLVVDFQGDYISDKIYVGNLYGTQYRVQNIGKDDAPSISTLFTFSPATASPSTNPVSAKATYAYGISTEAIPHPVWLYYGTGNYQTQADKTSSSMQYFFGLKDNLTLPSCYVYPTVPATPNPADPAVCGSLVELEAKYVSGTITNSEGDEETVYGRYIDGTPAVDESWIINLYNGQVDFDGPADLIGSERVIQQPLVAGGIVFFTTYIPDPDICKGNGKTWLFAVNYNTGGTPENIVFDMNGDGLFDENDKIQDPDDENKTFVVIAVPIEGGPGSKPVLGPDSTLFITTPVGGLQPVKVNIPDLKIELNSWKESNS
jgi:Tfp pilus tip-associated adhesin PilY1